MQYPCLTFGDTGCNNLAKSPGDAGYNILAKFRMIQGAISLLQFRVMQGILVISLLNSGSSRVQNLC